MLRLIATLGLSLCVDALVLASQALAAEVRLLLGPFGSFTEPKGLAVDQGSHDVYVIAGRSEVQRITISATAGKFKLEFDASSA